MRRCNLHGTTFPYYCPVCAEAPVSDTKPTTADRCDDCGRRLNARGNCWKCDAPVVEPEKYGQVAFISGAVVEPEPCEHGQSIQQGCKACDDEPEQTKCEHGIFMWKFCAKCEPEQPNPAFSTDPTRQNPEREQTTHAVNCRCNGGSDDVAAECERCKTTAPTCTHGYVERRLSERYCIACAIEAERARIRQIIEAVIPDEVTDGVYVRRNLLAAIRGGNDA